MDLKFRLNHDFGLIDRLYENYNFKTKIYNLAVINILLHAS